MEGNVSLPSSRLISQVSTIPTLKRTANDLESIDDFEPVKMEEAVKLGHHPLDFNFGILKGWVLILTMVVWSAVIGGIVALTVIGREPSVIHIHSQSNYYALRYGPSVIGTITTIWWRAITQSYNRIIPYVVMANMNLEPENGKQQQTIMGQALNNVYTDSVDVGAMRQLYKTRHWVTLIVNLSFLTTPILVPLKGSLVQITQGSYGWGVNVQPAIGWIITSIYLILLGTTLAILLRLSGTVTGLKQNPCSIAAQLSLLQNSDVPIMCEGLEFCNRRDLTWRIQDWCQRHGLLRLGYWRNKRRPEELVHCIRFLKYSQVTQVESDGSTSNLPDRLPEGENYQSKTKSRPLFRKLLGHREYNEHEKPVAYLFGSRATGRIPGVWSRPLGQIRYLSPPIILLEDSCIALLLIMLLSCLIVLAIMLGSGTLLKAHSYAGFVHGTFERGLLFSFVPGYIISFPNLVLLMSDNYHRALHPIRGMNQPNTARENILIDYISPNPLATILTAISNGHYQIFWGAFVALVCPLGPIVASSLFTFDDDLQTFHISPAAAYGALALVCLYILAVPFARIDVDYTAGRGLWNILDTLSFCYDSAILKCPEFRVREKTEDEEVFIQCRVILAKRLYQFRYYLGESGRRRMGFGVAKMMPLQSNNSEDTTRGYRLIEEDEEDASYEAVNVVDTTKAKFVVRGSWFYYWFRCTLVKSGLVHGLQRADTEMAIGESTFEGNQSLPSSESSSDRFESDALRMTPLHHIHSAVGVEDENANSTEDTADQQLGEVSFAQSTAVQPGDQEFNTLLRRQFTI